MSENFEWEWASFDADSIPAKQLAALMVKFEAGEIDNDTACDSIMAIVKEWTI
jgi:hypothetical protein